jgi:hypothetical protein
MRQAWQTIVVSPSRASVPCQGARTTHELGLIHHGRYNVLWRTNALVEGAPMKLGLLHRSRSRGRDRGRGRGGLLRCGISRHRKLRKQRWAMPPNNGGLRPRNRRAESQERPARQGSAPRYGPRRFKIYRRRVGHWMAWPRLTEPKK